MITSQMVLEKLISELIDQQNDLLKWVIMQDEDKSENKILNERVFELEVRLAKLYKEKWSIKD